MVGPGGGTPYAKVPLQGREPRDGEDHEDQQEDRPEPDNVGRGGRREEALAPLDAEEGLRLDHRDAHPALGAEALAVLFRHEAICLPHSHHTSDEMKDQPVGVQWLGRRKPEDVLEVEGIQLRLQELGRGRKFNQRSATKKIKRESHHKKDKDNREPTLQVPGGTPLEGSPALWGELLESPLSLGLSCRKLIPAPPVIRFGLQITQRLHSEVDSKPIAH